MLVLTSHPQEARLLPSQPHRSAPHTSAETSRRRQTRLIAACHQSPWQAQRRPHRPVCLHLRRLQPRHRTAPSCPSGSSTTKLTTRATTILTLRLVTRTRMPSSRTPANRAWMRAPLAARQSSHKASPRSLQRLLALCHHDRRSSRPADRPWTLPAVRLLSRLFPHRHGPRTTMTTTSTIPSGTGRLL